MSPTKMISREQFMLDNAALLQGSGAERPTRHAVYAIVHTPTKAMFIGATKNLQETYDYWFYRLRQIHTHPPLNWAFKAIYTMRSDFAFAVMESLPEGTPEADVVARLDIWLRKNKARGQQFDLNIGKSVASKAYWAERVREPWRFAKQPTHTPITKRKLVPGRVSTVTPAPAAPAEIDPLAEINELRKSQGKPPLTSLE